MVQVLSDLMRLLTLQIGVGEKNFLNDSTWDVLEKVNSLAKKYNL